MSAAAREPRAAYRVQLGPGFGLGEAADLVPYFHELGVSHLYLSPCLRSRRGSTHGYDVVDFARVDEELGGEAALARLFETLARHGMGLLLDLVPNHMAASARENPWWRDVLENGSSSAYADFFDVDWDAVAEEGGLVVPVLGDHYSRVLEAGEIRLAREGVRFEFRYGEHAFPASPASVADVLAPAAEACGSELLAFVARALRALPPPGALDPAGAEQAHRDREVLSTLLARLLEEAPHAKAAVDRELERLAADPDRLDLLLAQQSYRLAFWRLAAHELSYRRFFDIDQLVALRIEEPRVFAAVHRRVLRWLDEGLVDGLRIDHVDGLRDPEAYLHRLREARADLWLLVEKILEPDEALPDSWPVDGTTGYEFLNLAGGLFVDPAGEKPLTEVYAAFTGDARDYPTVLAESKRLVLARLFGSDLRRLTRIFAAVCQRQRRHRDHAATQIEEALAELIVHFPVYRSYVRPELGGVSEQDVRVVEEALEAARAAPSDLPGDLLDFLRDVLLLRVGGPEETELALRFQQLTGPAMAKGGEDTAFYAYVRCVALNEVGGDPARFGVAPEAFHAACAQKRERAPRALLATSTHDTKRSEDVRARLALLSEIPEAWAPALARWSARNERHRRGEMPDRSAEYLLYQTLVGAWPIEAPRAVAYMEKATREAKVHTSWRRPDPDYEEALRAFVEGALGDDGFRADLAAFVAPLVEPGRTNALAQVLLKLTAPGVPDLYRGTELFDLSLVDPDNRRPVDFALRRRLLAALEDASPEAVMARADEGLPKLWLIRQALRLRGRRRGCFSAGGSYTPLAAQGARRTHVVAYLRGEDVLAVVPRLVLGLAGDWADTELALPPGRWRNVLTGDAVGGATVAVEALLRRFPVALLEREERAP
jgi:(1->4)-alpha-D-glucan 1-alpha-D-glucosylmutase